MIHHRQRLTLRLEPGDDGLGVHAELDDLERDATADRLRLFGDIHHAATAFAKAFHQFVASERLADRFVRRVGHIELDGGLDEGSGWQFIRCVVGGE